MSRKHALLAATLGAIGTLHAQEAPQGAAIAATRAWLEQPAAERARQIPDVKLSGADAATAVQMVFDRLRDEARAARADELATTDGARRKPTNLLTVRAAGKALKVYERTFGDAPDRGHSLWISMHGGGGAPARVNDGQWNNQIELYQPKEGIYVAPRAPTNTWNLWHEGHIDDLFDRLIENYVIDRGVNPNRVYLMGYSAGGDGVYQLAPRMADRFAAASMMAGHPNGVPMDGLRNLPFMIWMGANDGAYKRNEQAATYGERLDALQEADPKGYVHATHIVAGKGHWMDREDRAALPWMAQYTRDPWPKKLVWRQSGRLHDRFYWLGLPAGAAKNGQLVRAEVDGQRITIESEGVPALRLRLNDALVNLDRPLEIRWNDDQQTVTATRSLRAVHASLRQRLDPSSAATAVVVLGG
ncbi:MAG: alpha/beta hydrolase [Planctomycetota bacterium]|nr:alpha/beta hydrolase [Planctomycetota bacterium]